MRFESRLAFVGGCLSLVVVAAACTTPPAPAAPEAPVAAEATAAEVIEQGRLLIIGGGCHDCHTPKKMGPNGPEFDFDRALSGHPQDKVITAGYKGPSQPWSTHTSDDLTAWSGAWGVTFAANITSDQNTGMGVWTEEMFMSAMKTGKHMGRGRPILPPMPWNFIGQLPDDRLKAMYAYLQSTKPISNRVPVPLGPDNKPIEAP